MLPSFSVVLLASLKNQRVAHEGDLDRAKKGREEVVS